MQAMFTRVQLRELVAALQGAGVRFVLLKGAARLFRGDNSSDQSTMYDLDVLVHKSEATRAADALLAAGYLFDKRRNSDKYWARHHHLPTLQPAGAGLSVELHTQLAPLGMLSLRTDWEACEKYMEVTHMDGQEALCFDSLGAAFHLVIHGAGLRRLHVGTEFRREGYNP